MNEKNAKKIRTCAKCKQEKPYMTAKEIQEHEKACSG